MSESSDLPGVETARSRDGTPIAARTWHPPVGIAARGGLLLVHGLGEHGGRYAHVARHLAALGLVVRAVDQRGFGASGGARAVIAHDGQLLDDVRDAWRAFRRDLDAARVHDAPFVMGHSLGGCVVGRAVTGGWIDDARGMILSSPAFRPRVSGAQRIAATIGARLVPGLRLPHGLPLDRLSHDPAVEAALRADPLAHDRVTPRLVKFMLDAGPRAIEDARACRTPTLLLVAGDDHLVDPDGARAFYAALPARLATLHVYPALYHEVLNEREEDRRVVLAELARWLEDRLTS